MFLGGTGGGLGGGGAILVGVNLAAVVDGGVGEPSRGDGGGRGEGGRGRGEEGRGEGVEGRKETDSDDGEGRRVDSTTSLVTSTQSW